MIAAFWAPSTIPGHNDSSSTALIVFQASKLVSVLINCSHCVPEHLCDSQVDLFPGLSPILTVLNSQNLYFHYKTLSKYMLLKYAMTVIYNGLIDQKKRRAFLEEDFAFCNNTLL